MGFNGVSYRGTQLNRLERTVVRDILLGCARAGLLPRRARSDPPVDPLIVPKIEEEQLMQELVKPGSELDEAKRDRKQALNKLLSRYRASTSSRTDRFVHASRFPMRIGACFDPAAARELAPLHGLPADAEAALPSVEIEPTGHVRGLPERINAHLPPEVRILSAVSIAGPYDPRASTVSRTYDFLVPLAALVPPSALSSEVERGLDHARAASAAANTSSRTPLAAGDVLGGGGSLQRPAGGVLGGGAHATKAGPLGRSEAVPLGDLSSHARAGLRRLRATLARLLGTHSVLNLTAAGEKRKLAMVTRAAFGEDEEGWSAYVECARGRAQQRATIGAGRTGVAPQPTNDRVEIDPATEVEGVEGYRLYNEALPAHVLRQGRAAFRFRDRMNRNLLDLRVADPACFVGQNQEAANWTPAVAAEGRVPSIFDMDTAALRRCESDAGAAAEWAATSPLSPLPASVDSASLPFVRVTLTGSAFVYNQIRYTLGLAVGVARGDLPATAAEAALHLPTAPPPMLAPPATLMLRTSDVASSNSVMMGWAAFGDAADNPVVPANLPAAGVAEAPFTAAYSPNLPGPSVIPRYKLLSDASVAAEAELAGASLQPALCAAVNALAGTHTLRGLIEQAEEIRWASSGWPLPSGRPVRAWQGAGAAWLGEVAGMNAVMAEARLQSIDDPAGPEAAALRAWHQIALLGDGYTPLTANWEKRVMLTWAGFLIRQDVRRCFAADAAAAKSGDQHATAETVVGIDHGGNRTLREAAEADWTVMRPTWLQGRLEHAALCFGEVHARSVAAHGDAAVEALWAARAAAVPAGDRLLRLAWHDPSAGSPPDAAHEAVWATGSAPRPEGDLAAALEFARVRLAALQKCELQMHPAALEQVPTVADAIGGDTGAVARSRSITAEQVRGWLHETGREHLNLERPSGRSSGPDDSVEAILRAIAGLSDEELFLFDSRALSWIAQYDGELLLEALGRPVEAPFGRAQPLQLLQWPLGDTEPWLAEVAGGLSLHDDPLQPIVSGVELPLDGMAATLGHELSSRVRPLLWDCSDRHNEHLEVHLEAPRASALEFLRSLHAAAAANASPSATATAAQQQLARALWLVRHEFGLSRTRARLPYAAPSLPELVDAQPRRLRSALHMLAGPLPSDRTLWAERGLASLTERGVLPALAMPSQLLAASLDLALRAADGQEDCPIDWEQLAEEERQRVAADPLALVQEHLVWEGWRQSARWYADRQAVRRAGKQLRRAERRKQDA